MSIEGEVRLILDKLRNSGNPHDSTTNEFYERELQIRNDALSAILKLTNLPKDFCDVCWTSSWMTVTKDTPNAQQVKGKDEWVLCQMCEADRNLIKLTNRPLSEKEVAQLLLRMYKHSATFAQMAKEVCSHFSKPQIKWLSSLTHSKYEDDYESGIIDGKNLMLEALRKLNGEGGV